MTTAHDPEERDEDIADDAPDAEEADEEEDASDGSPRAAPDQPRRRMPYIKFCGFMNAREAHTAVMLGADLIGINFWPGSPRAIHFGLGRQIHEAVKKASAERKSKRPARSVAVMVDAEPELVIEIMREVEPDILQFHGDEPVHVCRYFRTPFIKAFRAKGAGDITTIQTYLGGYMVAYLLDGASPTEYGGAGKMVSQPVASEIFKRVPRGFLAGGLTPDNIASLVRQTRPYGVDVASGIELRAGIKSLELMAGFIREVRAAVDNPLNL
jgi:phosphoribosylanthranilate isomerase